MDGLFFYLPSSKLYSVKPPLHCLYCNRNYKQSRMTKSAQDLRGALHAILDKRFRHSSMELLPVEGSRTRHQWLTVIWKSWYLILFIVFIFKFFMCMSIYLHVHM